jgi:hypothetical protein
MTDRITWRHTLLAHSSLVNTQQIVAVITRNRVVTVINLTDETPLYIRIIMRYEGVSKQVTNGSKTAIMNVICVSLGSSTVQFHDSLDSRRACSCSETGFSSQNGDRA